MKNSTRIILIIICLILALFLIGVLVWGIVLGGSYSMGELKVVKEETVSMSDINDLMIKTKSDDIIIYRTDDSDIKVVQKANRKLKEKDLFSIKKSGTKISIEGQRETILCFGFCFWGDSIYEIYLPKSYDKSLSIEVVSGDIRLESIDEETFSSLNLFTISGDISLNGSMKADNIFLKSTSGDIKTNSVEAKKIKEQTVSGDLENDTMIGEIVLKSTSGDIENKWVNGSVDVSTVSGGIEFDYLDVTGASSFNSTSGDIEIMLDKKASVRMSAKSVSGDIRFPSSESVIGDGTHSLSFHTVSGDIKVRVSK